MDGLGFMSILKGTSLQRWFRLIRYQVNERILELIHLQILEYGRYVYGIVSSARWVYLRNLSQAVRRVKDRIFPMFCALLNVFIISCFTRVRDSYCTDLVSKSGVCFGEREYHRYLKVCNSLPI